LRDLTQALSWNRKNVNITRQSQKQKDLNLELFSVPPLCYLIKNLKNSAGTYLKTACLVIRALNHPASVSLCQQHYMKILKVDSSDVQTAITSFSDTRFPSGNLWVDGNTSPTCSVLNRPILPPPPSSTFAPSTATCTNLYYSYCEYTGTCDIFRLTKKTLNVYFSQNKRYKP
jgi:hypothetical protein